MTENGRRDEAMDEARNNDDVGLVSQLERSEQEALARLRRRYIDVEPEAAQTVAAGTASLAALRELEHQLRHYVEFHDAVRSSAVWRVAQRLRRIVGREW